MKCTILVFMFLLGATTVFAQGTPAPPSVPAMVNNLSGKYEGTVKGQTEKASLELKSENGKPLGRLQIGQKSYDFEEGMFTEGALSLVSKEAKLNAKIDGDKLVGDLLVGTEKKSIELRKVTAAAASTAPAAATINLNGDWDGLADANGEPFPFLLTLKVDGENVTGGSSSQLGEAMIKTGSWKDGHLNFQLEGPNGTIVMSATVVEGKLSGEYDFVGQLQGKWVAVKKN